MFIDVSKPTDEADSNVYGIFVIEDEDATSDSYTKEKANKLYYHPVAAILGAYRLKGDMWTVEYVRVNSLVLKDCENYYTDKGWRIS